MDSELQYLGLGKIAGSLFIAIVHFTSCSTLQYSGNKESPLLQTQKGLERYNGDFNILSNDTSFLTLPHIFTYNNYFNPKRLPGKCDKIRLTALDQNRLEVAVFNDSTVITRKVIRGRLSEGRFYFKVRKISPIYIILNGYVWQTNQMELLENGDLSVHTKYGGLWFLTVVPTFGGRSEVRNLVFSRKQECH